MADNTTISDVNTNGTIITADGKEIPTPPWACDMPEGSYITTAPTFRVGEYFDLYHEDIYGTFSDEDKPNYSSLKYYFYDPTEHGYPKGKNYPLLIHLHGTSNALVGSTCINYSGAELYASPVYQADIRGAYILVPLANEYRENDSVKGHWCHDYINVLYDTINDFIAKHTNGVGKKFLFGNSSGATMTFLMGEAYPDYFNALIPVGSSALPGYDILDKWEENNVSLFFAIGKRDEFNDYNDTVVPHLPKLQSMKHCFIFTPDWVYNGDKCIASINFGIEMGQHCLVNAMHANLMFDDGTPMEESLPRGVTGWIDEVNRGGLGLGREYPPHGGYIKTGHVEIDDKFSASDDGTLASDSGALASDARISLFYEEYGKGDNIILSAQVGFYHRGMHQRMAELGYHVYCITLRGFLPSSLITADYKDRWYDVFASDVISFADAMGINKFTYMGASHGAGVGWHLMLQAQDRINSFIAMVAGPHSLKEGTMSYRQMLEQGIIKCPPPFDSPIDNDDDRQARRDYRNRWITTGPHAVAEEQKLDYGRPMMRFGSEEKLCEALKTISIPVLYIGGYDDPISTPELMMRSLGCLPHCKMIIYSNCGHNIDTDLIEEVSDEADRFIKNAKKTGRYYLPVEL